MRLAYKQLSFSRYAYDGEDQCLSPGVDDDDDDDDDNDNDDNYDDDDDAVFPGLEGRLAHL